MRSGSSEGHQNRHPGQEMDEGPLTQAAPTARHPWTFTNGRRNPFLLLESALPTSLPPEHTSTSLSHNEAAGRPP